MFEQSYSIQKICVRSVFLSINFYGFFPVTQPIPLGCLLYLVLDNSACRNPLLPHWLFLSSTRSFTPHTAPPSQVSSQYPRVGFFLHKSVNILGRHTLRLLVSNRPTIREVGEQFVMTRR